MAAQALETDGESWGVEIQLLRTLEPGHRGDGRIDRFKRPVGRRARAGPGGMNAERGTFEDTRVSQMQGGVGVR